MNTTKPAQDSRTASPANVHAALEGFVMNGKQATNFDAMTVALVRRTLADAWRRLRPEQRARISRPLLAEGILRSVASGERNPLRLRNAALTAVGTIRRLPAQRCEPTR